MTRIRFSILTIFTLIMLNVSAQQYEFGLSGVATGYMGDVNHSNPFYFKNLGGGLFAKYNLNSTWGFKLGYNYLAIDGHDQDFNNDFQQDRNLFFNNNLSEVSLVAEFNFFRYIAGRDINRYTPYLIGGIAGISHRPFIRYYDSKISLQELNLEVDENGSLVKYSKLALAIPLGVGFKYNIKGPWSIGAEVIYRTALTDNIDNVSKYYPSEIIIPNITLPDPSGTRNMTEEEWKYFAGAGNTNYDTRAGRARGDGKKLDGYMTAGITLTYTIISKKCYWWQ